MPISFPRCSVSAVLAVLALSPEVAGTGSQDIYCRAEPVEMRTGVVSLRIVHGALLDVPAECEAGGRPECHEATRFPVVCAASFAVESRESRGSGPRMDRSERGTVYLALRFDAADEDSFFDEFRRTLANLSPDAFTESFAGLNKGKPPLTDPDIAERSVEPSWTCFEDGSTYRVTRYWRTAGELPDGRPGIQALYTSTYEEDPIARPMCEGAASVVESSYPEEIRTAPLPTVLRETVVRVRIENGLARDSYADDLVALPEGATFTVEQAPGVVSSEGLSAATDGSFVKASRTDDAVKRTALTVPSELSPAAATRSAWVSRWTVETIERHLGPLPRDTRIGGDSLVIALLPTLPPVPLDENGTPRTVPPRARYPIRFDTAAFLEEVAQRLESQTDLGLETVEKAIAVRPEGLESEGWILVVCRPDGTADYGVPPTRASSPLTNAALFCAAAESRID